MDCLHKLCSYICKNIHNCPIEFKTNAPFEMKIYKLNSTKESSLAITTHMEKNPFGMAYPFTSKELEIYVKTVPKEDLQWVLKTFKKFPKINNAWAEYINKKKYAKPLWIVAILFICKAYEESNGKMTSSCSKNFKKILQEGAAPSQGQYLDEDAIEDMLRTEFKKGKKRTLTYKDIMSVASMSKEMHRKSKKLREDVKEEFELKKSFITKVIKELEEIPKTTSGNHYAMFALGNVPHASHYFSTSNSIAATGGNDLYNVSYYMKRDLTQEIYNQIRQVRQPHSLSVDISFSDANELQYYLRFNFVLSKEDGTTINMISISFIDTLNRLVVLYMYEPTLRLHIDPNIIENPAKEFIYTSMYTILGFLDFLITKYDLNQLTTNEQKQNTIRLNLVEVKQKTLDLLPSKIGFIEGGKKQIGKGCVGSKCKKETLSTIPEEASVSISKKSIDPAVYDAVIEHVSKKIGKTKSSLNKDYMSLLTSSKGMYSKSKDVQSKIKIDYETRIFPVKKVVKELEDTSKEHISLAKDNSYYQGNTDHITFTINRELTKDIFESLQNELRNNRFLNIDRYTYERLYNKYKNWLLQFQVSVDGLSIDNIPVVIKSLSVYITNIAHVGNRWNPRMLLFAPLMIYNNNKDYDDDDDDKLEINSNILSNPTTEYIYVSIFTILGFLEFLLTTHKLDSLFTIPEKREQFVQEVLTIKSIVLEQFPNFIEGGKKQVGKGPESEMTDVVESILRTDFKKDKSRTLTYKDIMNVASMSKDMYLKSKPLRSDIKKDFDLKQSYITKVIKEFEKVPQTFLTAPLSTTTNNNLPNSFYNTNHSANRIGSTSMEVINISYYFKKELTEDIYNYIQNEYSGFHTLRGEPYNSAKLFPYYLTFNFQYNIENNKVRDYSLNIMFMTSTRLHLPLYNYQTIPLPRLYIHNSILQNPTEEFMYVSIYTILGYLDFIIKTFDFNKLTHNELLQNTIRQIFIDTKQKTLDLLPSKIGIIEGGTGLTPAVCDPIVTYLTKDFAKGTGRKFSNADCMAFLKSSKVAYTTDKTFKTKIINAKRIENIQNLFEKIRKKTVTETQFKPKNMSYYVLVEPKNVGRHTTYRSSNLKYKAFTVMFYVTCKSSTNNKYFWFTFTLSEDDGISIKHLQCNLYENDNVITLFNYATLFDLSYDMYIEPSLSTTPSKELCNASIYTILGFIQFLSQSFDLSQLVKDKEKQEQIKFNLLAVKQNVMSVIKDTK
jgi:hypothetical protein